MAEIIFQFASSALTIFIFGHGIASRVARRYPIFYCYLGYLSLSGPGLRWVAHLSPAHYLELYWYNAYISLALGFGVIWEAYGLIFRDFPGSARMARFLVTFSLAAIFIGSVLLMTIWQPTNIGWLTEILRVSRMVQVILLLWVWVLVLYYEIPLGANVSGIVFGYGAYVLVSFLLLTVRGSVPPEYFNLWRYAQSYAFVLAKLAWLYALWSYQPVPASRVARADELAYPFLPQGTRMAMARVKDSLGRALQS